MTAMFSTSWHGGNGADKNGGHGNFNADINTWDVRKSHNTT